MDVANVDFYRAVKQPVRERQRLAVELVVALALQGGDRAEVPVFLFRKRILILVVRLVIFGLFDLVFLLALNCTVPGLLALLDWVFILVVGPRLVFHAGQDQPIRLLP